jgi:glycosyltransferase involved in cell wall biosynthesis
MTPARPRQVAILIDSLDTGGAERVAVEAAGALDRDRYVPHLVVTRHDGPLGRLAHDRGVRTTVLDRQWGFAPRKLARALSIVRDSALLHAHLWGSAMWGAAFARATRRPLIAHTHGFDADSSSAWLRGYRYWIAPAAHRIVCVSGELAAALRDGGIPPAKVTVVENGVSLEDPLTRDEARAALGLPTRGRVIGMVAGLRQEKRHDLALRSLALLRAEGRDVTLCFVGDGREREALHRLARELSVEDRVVWAGLRDHAGRLMRAFDVVLICSTIEGMPLGALEALVAGVPLVTTRVGALPELLAHGGGVIVPAADPPSVCVTLSAVLDGIGGLANAASAARARDAYSIDRVARELESIYDGALGVPKPARW